MLPSATIWHLPRWDSGPSLCCVTHRLQILAKEIVHSNKAISRLYVNKAQMISIQGALSEQLGACVACVS